MSKFVNSRPPRLTEMSIVHIAYILYIYIKLFYIILFIKMSILQKFGDWKVFLI